MYYSYAEVVVTSEESLKTLLEKIPQCYINGEKIDCRFATLQNLSVFEDIAKKRKLEHREFRKSSLCVQSFSVTDDFNRPSFSQVYPYV